jgi:hypothetical protein
VTIEVHRYRRAMTGVTTGVRRNARWLVLGSVAVAAIGTAVWVNRPGDLTRVPIEYVALVPNSDGRSIEVHLTYSSCLEFDRLVTDESIGNVRLAAYVHDRPSCGTAPTTEHVAPLRLGSPLLNRRIIDHAGNPLTVAS